MVQPRFLQQPARIPNPRRVRAATQRRIVRTSRARSATVRRVFGIVTGVLALLMAYVVLTASLTGLSYAVGKERAHREELQEQTMRLDDRIAALRSDDRLAALAARMGMHEPQTFAVVRMEAPRVARVRPRFALLSSLAGLFAPAMSRRQ